MIGTDPVFRVVLAGAESTGKTTLCRQLANHYGTSWVAEYGRELWERKLTGGIVDKDGVPEWTDQDFIDIAREQQRREDLAAGQARRLLICDTNASATSIWYERYAGRRHAEVDAIAASDLVDLYLLLAPDVPFVADGVRDGAHIRNWMHARFLELVGSQGAPWRLVSGPWETRFAQATDAVDALLVSGARPARRQT